MREYVLTVDEESDGLRVDKYLSVQLSDMSRSYIQKIIDGNLVTVNEKICKSSTKIACDDTVKLVVDDCESANIVAENIPLEILYEDEDVIVVNKPKNMVVHPAPGHYTGTLVNALLYHCQDNLSGINGVLRPGIVHRIDRDTTGSVIACKNDHAHACISEQLKNHSIKREYVAVVIGNINDEEGIIDTMIGRSPQDRKKMSIHPASAGKRAITHYKVIKRYKGYTYISLRLETGRTHQIRVHMSSIGHPIVGDEVYGNAKSPIKLNGQALHAKTLGFVHPNGTYIETDAPLFEEFNKLLNYLNNNCT